MAAPAALTRGRPSILPLGAGPARGLGPRVVRLLAEVGRSPVARPATTPREKLPPATACPRSCRADGPFPPPS
jgi:hypothetical protein